MYMDEYFWEINYLIVVKLLDFFILIVYIIYIKLSILNFDISIFYVVYILFS